MTSPKEVTSFKFPSALTFYWPFWLQQHMVLNFLFLKSSLSSWLHLQSFLFPSWVPDTKTGKLGVILVFSTPTIPVQFQDSLDSFLIRSLQVDPLIFPFLPKRTQGPLPWEQIYHRCSYNCRLPASTHCSHQCQVSLPKCHLENILFSPALDTQSPP